MEPDTEIMLLRDEGVVPTNSVLEKATGKFLYAVYSQLIGSVINEHGLEIQWRYYKDGKSWLCKAVYKKKTVFWLSIWEGFIRTSFFFKDKTKSSILDLNIDDKLKENFERAKPIGKLIPFVVDILSFESLAGFLEIVVYKKSLK